MFETTILFALIPRNKAFPSARRIAGALLLLLGLLLGGSTLANAQPLRPGAAPPVDGVRMWRDVATQVAFGPRYAGAPGHGRQLAWMRDFFAAVADSVAVQPFEHRAADGTLLRMTNLIAHFGTDRADRVLLVAHWDTRPRADEAFDPVEREVPVPGANDGGSGVAVLMEIARALRAAPPPMGVDLLLTDGEDFGDMDADRSIGARYFAARVPAGAKPRAALILDMVGDAEPRFPVEEASRRAAPALVRRLWALADTLGYGDVFVDASAGEIEDDHLPLIAAGIPAVDVIDLEYGPGNRYWHTQRDLPQHTSAATLRMVAEVVVAWIYRGG